MDAGALRIEFFGDLMRQVNSILFDGKEKNHVPFHSWHKVHLLQMGGLMLAHSRPQDTTAPLVSKNIWVCQKTF